MSDEEMPFLLMLQEANALAEPHAVDEGLKTTAAVYSPARTQERSRHDVSNAPDAVQMTPELWQRGNYIHRLNNEFSLDLSQPMALAIPGHPNGEEQQLCDLADDEEYRFVATDQLPFLETKILEDARPSLASRNDFEPLDGDDDDELRTPPEGAPSEFYLDSHALEAMAVGTQSSDNVMPDDRDPRCGGGAGKIGRGAGRLLSPPDLSISFDDGDVTPPAIESVAAEVALRVLEGDEDAHLGAEFDRQMRQHFNEDFGRDLGEALQVALRDASTSGTLDCGATASARRTLSFAPRSEPLDASSESLAPMSPFADDEWQFAVTVNAGGQSGAGDVHDLSTEISVPQVKRTRPVARSKRMTRQRAAAMVLKEPTQEGRLLRLPWESLHSSQLRDSGWEAESDEAKPVHHSQNLTAVQPAGERTASEVSPQTRAAHRRARELFLGAVAHYRGGRLPAAHADALLACVFDPQNVTYKNMAARWSEELKEQDHRVHPR